MSELSKFSKFAVKTALGAGNILMRYHGRLQTFE